MQESIVFLVRVQCRRKDSSRSLSRSPDEFLVSNDYYQFTFKDLNGDENFVNNDMLNSSVVNFDKFCKNTFKI